MIMSWKDQTIAKCLTTDIIVKWKTIPSIVYADWRPEANCRVLHSSCSGGNQIRSISNSTPYAKASGHATTIQEASAFMLPYIEKLYGLNLDDLDWAFLSFPLLHHTPLRDPKSNRPLYKAWVLCLFTPSLFFSHGIAVLLNVCHRHAWKSGLWPWQIPSSLWRSFLPSQLMLDTLSAFSFMSVFTSL